MKILLIRHGETDWNKNTKIQGTTDIPLNDNGIETSLKSGKKLSEYKIDYVYSSTLDRAYKTAIHMLKGANLNLDITKDKRLIEISFGKYEGISFDEFRNLKKEEKQQHIEDENITHLRLKNFLTEAFLKHKNQTIMVVTHGGCIRTLLQKEKLIPSREEINSNEQYHIYRRILNNSIHELEFDGTNFKLIKFSL